MVGDVCVGTVERIDEKFVNYDTIPGETCVSVLEECLQDLMAQSPVDLRLVLSVGLKSSFWTEREQQLFSKYCIEALVFFNTLFKNADDSFTPESGTPDGPLNFDCAFYFGKYAAHTYFHRICSILLEITEVDHSTSYGGFLTYRSAEIHINKDMKIYLELVQENNQVAIKLDNNPAYLPTLAQNCFQILEILQITGPQSLSDAVVLLSSSVDDTTIVDYKNLEQNQDSMFCQDFFDKRSIPVENFRPFLSN